MKKWYAKSKRPGRKQVEVKEHLCAVGELSKEYGRQLGMEKEAEMAGTVHDAGKLTDKFQDVLEGNASRVDHARVSAAFLRWFLIATQKCTSKEIASTNYAPILEAINAHHGTLLCYDQLKYSLRECMTAQKWLEGNDGKEVALTGKENYRVLAEIFHEELPQWECPEPKIMTLGEEERMLWSRMLLSCLVDADYTASAEEDGEIISGKTLQVTEHAVTLEEQGEIPFGEVCEGYYQKEEVHSSNINDIPIGYAFTDYLIKDGKICAFLILPKERMEYIRVAIQQSDYRGLYHKEVVLQSSEELMLSYLENGERKEEPLPAGKKLVLTQDTDYLKEGMLKVVNPTNSGRTDLLSAHRNQGIPSYRGNFEIHKTGDGLLLINELLLEEYLYAVVPSEMPSTYPSESLKAQAVCARTYSYGYLEHAGLPALGAHVDDSVNYQVYNNIMEKKSSTDAVRQTEGELLLQDGKPITAYYYSTSCGYGTDDRIWKEEGEDAAPYLRSVHIAQDENNESQGINEQTDTTQTDELQKKSEQPVANQQDNSQKNLEQKNNEDIDNKLSDLTQEEVLREYLTTIHEEDYEKEEPWYRWSYTVNDLDINLLKKKLQERGISFADFKKIKDMEIIRRAAGGSARTLVISTDQGELQVEGEYEIRYVLNQEGEVIRQDDSAFTLSTILPSAYFVMDLQKGKKGITGFTLYGGGFGHGVGMSQNAAKAMAQSGKTYEEILAMFYWNCQLAKKY